MTTYPVTMTTEDRLAVLRTRMSGHDRLIDAAEVAVDWQMYTGEKMRVVFDDDASYRVIPDTERGETPRAMYPCDACDATGTRGYGLDCAACEGTGQIEATCAMTPTICATSPLRTGALAIVQMQWAYHVVVVDAEGTASRMDDAEFWTFEAAYSRMSFEAGRLETRGPVGSHVGTVTNSEWRMARER